MVRLQTIGDAQLERFLVNGECASDIVGLLDLGFKLLLRPLEIFNFLVRVSLRAHLCNAWHISWHIWQLHLPLLLFSLESHRRSVLSTLELDIDVAMS